MIVTGVGSLPHTDPSAAARFVADTTDLPYLPQLPNRHREEGMIRQWGDGLCGCGASGGIGLAYGPPPGPVSEGFVGATAYLSVHHGGPVKTQLTGPVTMAMALSAAGHPKAGLWDCVVEGLLQRLDEHVAWVAAATRATPFVVVDEPGLGVLGPGGTVPQRRADAIAALRAFFAASPVPLGLHCCAETDWSLVASLAPSVISWDVESLMGGALAGSAAAVAEAVAGGTAVAWGLVPARSGPAPRAGVLRARYGTAVATLVLEGAPVAALTDEAWITPACGLAGLSEEDALAVAETVRALAGGLDG